jgi:hypothetical protein
MLCHEFKLSLLENTRPRAQFFHPEFVSYRLGAGANALVCSRLGFTRIGGAQLKSLPWGDRFIFSQAQGRTE